jgi:tetratricopeptide (TPR) repeat protein
LSNAVNTALRESGALIVVCSPSAAASQWVNEEVRAFRALGTSDRIFAVIVDGEPGAPDQQNCFPEALTEGGLEPVAADARPGGDGRRNAFLKIAAGLLGVGFDELKQREQHRHQRRLAGITTASLLIAALTITLAVTATIARNEADLRRQQAEDLIGFMLGDLRDQLHEIQRLDIFESVGDKAVEYFSQLDEEDESDHSLSQRAMALRQIGEVRQDQGNLSEAYESFADSERIMLELARRQPDDPDTQIELANSHFFVGYVFWERGDLQQARRQFELVLPIVGRLRANDPTNTTWLVESGYSFTNLGRILELEGDLLSALAAYQEVMRANQALVELEPDEPDWKLELGFAHNNLGKVLTTLGRLDEAKYHYGEDLAIKSRLLHDNPDHELWRSYKADSEYFLGWVLANSAEIDKGTALLRSARASYEQLTAISADHALFKDRRARVERALADVLARQGDIEAAGDLAKQSAEASRDLLSGDDSNSRWRRGLAEALLLSTMIETMRGDNAASENYSRAADAQVGILLEREPDNLETQQLAVRNDLTRAQYGEALVRLGEHFGESNNPWVLEMLARALAATGEHDKAVDIHRRLADMGFRNVDRVDYQ